MAPQRRAESTVPCGSPGQRRLRCPRPSRDRARPGSRSPRCRRPRSDRQAIRVGATRGCLALQLSADVLQIRARPSLPACRCNGSASVSGYRPAATIRFAIRVLAGGSPARLLVVCVSRRSRDVLGGACPGRQAPPRASGPPRHGAIISTSPIPGMVARFVT